MLRALDPRDQRAAAVGLFIHGHVVCYPAAFLAEVVVLFGSHGEMLRTWAVPQCSLRYDL